MCRLRTLVMAWVPGSCAHCHRAASQEGILLRLASPGKDPDSKSAIWFPLNAYHFCTIVKPKSPKLNRCEVRDLLYKLC